ncbi:thiol peroxidase [Pseudalkalibacillus caeni]|uniref:Thiol peroxidase n=1 Tax=Exobacillus caeni TaxID=2574798 RepID=A0A5R9FBR5_9BACL|nr:thiol peroxidase [Pseudalkalibacillus caeni]TLS39108.1 thiol peroxidase [Pseudalkalibacillus caeni]
MSDITFKGEKVNLMGDRVKEGQKAPDFTVLGNDMSKKSLNDFDGVLLISVVPSLDTGVCDSQTRRFNEEAETLNAKVLTISVDLPFAQKRWCGAAGVDNVETLSDHYDLSFGKAFGVAIEELRLLARSVFVIDSNKNVTYCEYVKEVTDYPDFEAALEAASKAE